jgi:DNA-directed RNA polymerase specialized sigma24 family protein
MKPQPQRTRQERAFHGRLVGLPPEPEDQNAVQTKPSPLETHEPVDALYYRLLHQFTPAEDVAIPVVTLTPGELAERAKHREEINRYDVNKYRKEINLGLKHARVLLRGFATSWRDSQDLKQEVDIAIWWEATRRYKDGMNGALAYTIAKNHGKKFLKRQLKEQTIAVTTPSSGKLTPVLDEFGEPKRIPRFESFDVKGTDVDGEPRETSRAEEQIVTAALPEADDPALDKLTLNLPVLRRLVKTWYGAKRIVGEVLLKTPDATVRDFPCVPKSTACKVRKVVKAEFRALLGGMGQESPTQTY